jgi:hypothetical protein
LSERTYLSVGIYYAEGKFKPDPVRPELAKGILNEPLPTRLLCVAEATLTFLPCASALAGAICFVVAPLTCIGNTGIGSGTGGGAGALTERHIFNSPFVVFVFLLND